MKRVWFCMPVVLSGGSFHFSDESHPDAAGQSSRTPGAPMSFTPVMRDSVQDSVRDSVRDSVQDSEPGEVVAKFRSDDLAPPSSTDALLSAHNDNRVRLETQEQVNYQRALVALARQASSPSRAVDSEREPLPTV